MTLSILQLQALFNAWLWPFIRISTMLMAMSLFGAQLVPARIRILLAIGITALLVPSLPAMPDVKLFSGTGFNIVFAQVTIGVAMGFATRMLFETFVIGAQMVAMQAGLGFASLIDPTNGVQVPVLGQFFLMLATLVFLALDGHLLMIKILVESFHSLPVSTELPRAAAIWSLIGFGRWMFAGALLMALSAALALLVVNITFGVLTRAAPQLNIFAIGFPITMLSGLIIVWLTLSGFSGHFEQQFGRTTTLVCHLVQLEC